MTAVDLHQTPADVDKPEVDDQQHWSVTTLIGALDKKALVYWAAKETALAAVHQFDAWVGLAKQNRADAVKWLSNARFRTPEGELGAADFGTSVHAAIEHYTLRGARPNDDEIDLIIGQNGGNEFNDDQLAVQRAAVNGMVDQFDRWAQRFTPEYQATEVTVYSPRFGYAGTCDGFLTIDGVRFIIDYKTSKKSFDGRGKPTAPYPDAVALQLAAYRYAELAAVWRPRRFEQFRRRYYLICESERALAVPVPEVDAGLAIHITPEHCNAHPIQCHEPVFDAFLAVVDSARWLFQDSKNVMGDPLEPVGD